MPKLNIVYQGKCAAKFMSFELWANKIDQYGCKFYWMFESCIDLLVVSL